MIVHRDSGVFVVVFGLTFNKNAAKVCLYVRFMGTFYGHILWTHLMDTKVGRYLPKGYPCVLDFDFNQNR